MKIEFLSERGLGLWGWVFLGAVGVGVGIMTAFGYLAGVTIVQGWGDLEGPGVDAQGVGALALIEGVLAVLLVVLAVAFSRTASKKMHHQDTKTSRKIRRLRRLRRFKPSEQSV